MKKKKTYIEIDFYKLWRYVRLERLQKEKIKSLLFIPFPFLFNRFAAYQHWKDAQIFSIKGKSHLKQRAHTGFNKKETGTIAVPKIYYSDKKENKLYFYTKAGRKERLGAISFE